MKKSIKYSILTLLTFSITTLCGCTNQSKTLAKNLDNAITNLVYSATNLDFANASNLGSFLFDDNEQIQEDNDLNINQIYDNQNEYDIAEHQNIFTDKSSSSTNNPQIKNANYCNNCVNLDTKQQNEAIFNNSKRSGFPGFRHKFTPTPQTINSQKNQYNTQNLALQEEVSDTNNNEKSTIQLVSFSTDKLNENNQTVQSLISEIINKRSNLLLYINDLYKGNISISTSNIDAVNAYINIIKDNTSYFNQHRGIITNQLEQARQTMNSDENSSLINAYIIRSNEALSTRIVKLESSIEAIDSITLIIKGSESEESKSYIANNYSTKSLSQNNSIFENGNTSQDDIFNHQPIDPRIPFGPANINFENYSNPNFQELYDYKNQSGLDNTNTNTQSTNIPEQNNNADTQIPPQFPKRLPKTAPNIDTFGLYNLPQKCSISEQIYSDNNDNTILDNNNTTYSKNNNFNDIGKEENPTETPIDSNNYTPQNTNISDCKNCLIDNELLGSKNEKISIANYKNNCPDCELFEDQNQTISEAENNELLTNINNTNEDENNQEKTTNERSVTNNNQSEINKNQENQNYKKSNFKTEQQTKEQSKTNKNDNQNNATNTTENTINNQKKSPKSTTENNLKNKNYTDEKTKKSEGEKQESKQNIVNEKIRNDQQEIQQTKLKFDSNKAIKNLSFSFLEDKTNKNSRLKTIKNK